MTGETTGRAEARARQLLVAYPWRMRAEQGDEIVATVLDTLPAGATRLPWRTAVDLVRGGIRTRRQRRPPFLTRLAFEFGQTIHPRWIWWVYDRLEDPRYRRNDLLRRLAWSGLSLLPFVLLVWDRGAVLIVGASFALSSLVGARIWSEWQRNTIRRRYGLLPGGSDPRVVWVRRDRRSLLGRKVRQSVFPVPWNVLRYMPDAEVWTPEGQDGARTDASPSGPGT